MPSISIWSSKLRKSFAYKIYCTKIIFRSIYSALKDFEKKDDKKLVIIKGVGEKSFCAGGDVRAVVEGPVAAGKEFFRNEYRNNELIGNYKKPYIAVIDGITM